MVEHEIQERVVWTELSPRGKIEYSCQGCDSSTADQKRSLYADVTLLDFWTYCMPCAYVRMQEDRENIKNARREVL